MSGCLIIICVCNELLLERWIFIWCFLSCWTCECQRLHRDATTNTNTGIHTEANEFVPTWVTLLMEEVHWTWAWEDGSDEGKQTRAELTARNQLQCEAESMLGATATRGRRSVNGNKNESLSTLICVSQQIHQLITARGDSQPTGVCSWNEHKHCLLDATRPRLTTQRPGQHVGQG